MIRWWIAAWIVFWPVAGGWMTATETARAETCKPPNVARVELVAKVTRGRLVCPPDGECSREFEVRGDYRSVICLTPDEHAAALARQP